MKNCTLLSILLLVAALGIAQSPASREAASQAVAPVRIYVEEHITAVGLANVNCNASGNCFGSNRTYGRNVSLEVTKEFVKQCSNLVTVTNNREAADFSLKIATGNSTLYNKAGDVSYISPAKFKASNLAKDVCKYLKASRQQKG